MCTPYFYNLNNDAMDALDIVIPLTLSLVRLFWRVQHPLLRFLFLFLFCYIEDLTHAHTRQTSSLLSVELYLEDTPTINVKSIITILCTQR